MDFWLQINKENEYGGSKAKFSSGKPEAVLRVQFGLFNIHSDFWAASVRTLKLSFELYTENKLSF